MSEVSEMEEAVEPGGLKAWVIWVIAVLVVAAGGGGFVVLEKTGPKADKENPPGLIPVVRVVTVKSEEKQMYVSTQARSTQAASEVMGRVTDVSDKFKPGGVFKRGEVMLEIDSADYVSALANAEASLADAQLVLQQEEARAEQARRDWGKLGRGDPSDLVMRKPQIVSAKARESHARFGPDQVACAI